MAQSPEGTSPGPDEMDRHLRDLTAGLGGEAHFKEPSAAERARRPAQPGPAQPGPVSRPGSRPGWRSARKARKLRRPVPEPGRQPVKFQRARPGRRPAGSWQATPKARSMRLRRAKSAAKRIGALVLFAALIYGLHRVGLGPQ